MSVVDISDKIDLKIEESMYKSQPAKIRQNLRFGTELLDVRKGTGLKMN